MTPEVARRPPNRPTARARGRRPGVAFGLAAVLATAVTAVGVRPAEAKNFGASKTEWRLLATTGAYGQPFSLTVYVIDDSTSCDLPPYPYGCNTPTGQVYFFVDGNPGYSATAQVRPFDADFSTATATISNLPAGPHTVRALYVGGPSSVSNPRPFHNSEATVGITITQAKVTGALTSSANPAGVAQPVTFTLTVAPNPAVHTAGGAVLPSGNVQFVDITNGANTILATKALTGGSATHAVGNLPPGTTRVAGVYLGDANYEARSIGQVDQVVARARPAISTVASPGNLLGAPVHDTAFVTGGVNPTGTVTFRLFSDPTCATQVFTSTKALVGGAATSDRFTPSAPGTYRWTARYNGDAINEAVLSGCNAPGESVTIRPFAPPAPSRTIRGDLTGPVTVNAGESVLVDGGRILGSITVRPGGALSVVNSRIRGSITADTPAFFSLCGSAVHHGSSGAAVTVANAPVPVRVGDPAAGCAGNELTGAANLTANLGGTVGGNSVTGGVAVNGHGPGNTVVKANTLTATLSCSASSPAPGNSGQLNTAGAKAGQCAAL